MTAPSIPHSSAATKRDLTDAEFAELDELLAATPAPLEALDAVMLDGFLCGVLVQPVLLKDAQWLPFVFDADGQPLPDTVDATWLARTQSLIMQRYTALNRAMAEDGWFNPLILELDDDEDAVQEDAGAPASSESAGDEAQAQAVKDLPPVSQALMPWVTGLMLATEQFTGLSDMPDDAVHVALARLYRHLPTQTDEERDLVALLDREHPLTTLDAAIEELVVTVADLWDLTRASRYKVDTIQRDTPKQGRNDPCACGSGKKFKACHGAM
jgi:uncharacterized protein